MSIRFYFNCILLGISGKGKLATVDSGRGQRKASGEDHRDTERESRGGTRKALLEARLRPKRDEDPRAGDAEQKPEEQPGPHGERPGDSADGHELSVPGLEGGEGGDGEKTD